MKEKQFNSNKYLIICIVVLLSLLVMNSCGYANQNSDNADASDSLASYVSEFDTLYNWEGVYYGREDFEDELHEENNEYSLTIKKDSIIFRCLCITGTYLFYSKYLGPGKIKLIGLKDLREDVTDDILNKDFGVLSIEEEGKKIVWNSDFYLLGPQGEPHILLEYKEYDGYVDSMTAAVWRIMNVIDSVYKDQWIGSYNADIHYVRPKKIDGEFDSIKKELRLDIMSDSIKVYINDTVIDFVISAGGNADSVFLYTQTNNLIAPGRDIGYIYKNKQDQYIWKSTEDKSIYEILDYMSIYLRNHNSEFNFADDSIILKK
ncbi:MAG: hypothetical protein IK131_13075 [Paludibacteraceae bacterium]|nr:hypothetical protein [Paludibacteraceae bacterium]